jgi:hypothetical protein
VIRSLEAFNELREEQSLSAFDIAVVDLHLSDGYEDFQGDAIARTIHGMGIALPVVMMTLKPPTNRSIPEWIKKRGLVDVIYKEHDADGFSVDFVAERIEDLLAGDPVEAVCEQMVVQVHTLRRKAIRRHSRKPHALRDQYLKRWTTTQTRSRRLRREETSPPRGSRWPGSSRFGESELVPRVRVLLRLALARTLRRSWTRSLGCSGCQQKLSTSHL